jgi:(p)ppGpp synthase/HD superfamily hydrolase
VAGLAMEYGASEDEAIAALLHDAVEDQGGKPILEEIRRQFGHHVASIVDGCTDTDQQPKPPWRERKQAYIDHVAHASPSICLVSACDKLHNARCILSDVRFEGEAAYEKFNGKKDGTLWYYRALVNAFAGKIPKRLADELQRVVSDLERVSSNLGRQ